MTPLRGWECESCRSNRAVPGGRILRPYGAGNARAAGQTGRCPVGEYCAPTGLGAECRSNRAMPGENMRPYGAGMRAAGQTGRAGERILRPYGAGNAKAAGQTGRCPVREYFAPTGLGLESRPGNTGRCPVGEYYAPTGLGIGVSAGTTGRCPVREYDAPTGLGMRKLPVKPGGARWENIAPV